MDIIEYYNDYGYEPDLSQRQEYTPTSDNTSYYVFNENGQYYFYSQIGLNGYGTYQYIDGVLWMDNEQSTYIAVTKDGILQAINETGLLHVFQKSSDDVNPTDNSNYSFWLSDGSPLVSYSLYPIDHDQDMSYQLTIEGTDYTQLTIQNGNQLYLSFHTYGGSEVYSLWLSTYGFDNNIWPSLLSAYNDDIGVYVYVTFQGPWSYRVEIYGLFEEDVVMYFSPMAG